MTSRLDDDAYGCYLFLARLKFLSTQIQKKVTPVSVIITPRRHQRLLACTIYIKTDFLIYIMLFLCAVLSVI